MPVGWHPNRWWDWGMSENEKRETDPMFIRVIKQWVGSIQVGGIETFLPLEILKHI